MITLGAAFHGGARLHRLRARHRRRASPSVTTRTVSRSRWPAIPPRGASPRRTKSRSLSTHRVISSRSRARRPRRVSRWVSTGNQQPFIASGDPSTTWTAAQTHEIALGSAFNSGGNLTRSPARLCQRALPPALTRIASRFPWPAIRPRGARPRRSEFTLTGVRFGVAGTPYTLSCVSATYCLDLGHTQLGPYQIQGGPAAWDHATPTPLTAVNSRSEIDAALLLVVDVLRRRRL